MMRKRAAALNRRLARQYNFASSKYVSCFGNLQYLDREDLRKQALEFLNKFDKQAWFDNPMHTILNGKGFTEGTGLVTVDAFNYENGKEIHGTSEVVDAVIEHLKTYQPPKRDFREAARKIEQDLFANYAGELIGNQAVDFMKQDGLTEIEEWAEASTVEKRIADLLFKAEEKEEITIRRNFAFVSCVSNFTNFLDLSRKTLRNIELGVPALVLSRSNTGQHMFRWFEILQTLAEKHGIDSGMITFLCADLKEQQRVIEAFPDSPFYFTGSREVADKIKQQTENLMSSTGGPNTMIAEEFDENIAQASAWSTMIENSGQCTAQRLLVVDNKLRNVIEDKAAASFSANYSPINESKESLETGGFAGVFNSSRFDLASGYKTIDENKSVAFRMNGEDFPKDINEMWRQSYVDISTADLKNEENLLELSKWLLKHQPITTVFNGKEMPFELLNFVFEHTALVVYTIGNSEKPALTVAAKPQDGEVFGEFPPRHELNRYTKFPMVVPSPSPAYHAVYQNSFLQKQANKQFPISCMSGLVDKVTNKAVRGYCQVIGDYLVDACSQTPIKGGHPEGRTALFGLQRTPKQTMSAIRCSDLDDLLPRLIPFYGTNAYESIFVSTTSQNVYEKARSFGVNVEIQSEQAFDEWCSENSPWNIVQATKMTDFPLVGQFVSTLLPLGHVKSTRTNDTEFINFMSKSEKWLKVREF